MTSYARPTSDQIDAAMPLLSSPQHEAYFFSRLDNPLWVAPLAERDVFKYPPSAEQVQEGGFHYPTWPPTQYLAKMAAHAPAEVATVFKTISTDNESIIGDLLDAALSMPADHAISLVPAICRAAKARVLSIAFGSAVDLCATLAQSGQEAPAIELADALFTPRFKKETREPLEQDKYWYKEGLAKIVPALAPRAADKFLRRLCAWLKGFIDADERIEQPPASDLSHIWRPAIEEHHQNPDYDLVSVMVGLVRMGFEEAIRTAGFAVADALNLLDTYQSLVFKRMRLHLINEFADQVPDLACSTMLDRGLFNDHQYKHEYAMLMGRHFGLLSAPQRAEWYAWVDEGPDMSGFDEFVRRHHGREPTNADRQARIDWWKYERLHWVRDHLDGERQTFYNTMHSKHGEPEMADLSSRTRLRWGDESPMTVKNLAAMTFEKAVSAVTSWQPEQSRFDGPSIEGLSATFRQYLAIDPVGFSAKAATLINRPAVFVRSFISQLSEAAKEGLDINVLAVINLGQWVLHRPVQERTTPEQEDESMVDRDWQWTRDEVSRFAENVCRATVNEWPRYPLEGIREPLWNLIAGLCRDCPESYIKRDVSDTDPRVQDYLDLGINSPRGKAVEAALEYGRWVANHIKRIEKKQEFVPGGFEAMPELREELEWQIAPGNRTPEVLSIIGSRIGLIYWIDKTWLADNAGRIFHLEGIEEAPSAAEGWAAWNAFLVWVNPHIEFYQLFEPQFRYAVEQTAGVELPERAHQQPVYHLGEHLVILYGRGQIGFDEDGSLLWRFIETAGPDVRRHAIKFVGTSLNGDDKVSEEITNRFAVLWDWYWAGLGRYDAESKPDAWLFGIWFACGQFPVDWALDRLQQFTEVVPVPQPDHVIVRKLAEIAEVDIQKATSILDRMVRNDREGWHISSWREFAQAILEQAMKSGGSPRQLAESLINHLGRRGYTEFGRLLGQ